MGPCKALPVLLVLRYFCVWYTRVYILVNCTGYKLTNRGVTVVTNYKPIALLAITNLLPIATNLLPVVLLPCYKQARSGNVLQGNTNSGNLHFQKLLSRPMTSEQVYTYFTEVIG